jgi:hypothetical protein
MELTDAVRRPADTSPSKAIRKLIAGVAILYFIDRLYKLFVKGTTARLNSFHKICGDRQTIQCSDQIPLDEGSMRRCAGERQSGL